MVNTIEIVGVVKDAPVEIRNYGGNKLYSFKLSFKSREIDKSENLVEVRIQGSTGGFAKIREGRTIKVCGSLRNHINRNKKPRVVTIIYADYVNTADRNVFLNKVELQGTLSDRVFDMTYNNSRKSFCRRNLILDLREEKSVTISLLGWGRVATRLSNLKASSSYYKVFGRLSGHSYKYKANGTYKTCTSVEVVIDDCFSCDML